MATPVGAYTTTIARGDGASPEVFSTVPKVENLGLPELSVTLVDGTVFGDEFPVRVATGQRSIGEISFTIQYDQSDSVHSAIRGQWTGKTASNYKITKPSGTTSIVMSCYVSRWQETAERDGLLKVNVTLSPSGSPTVV